MWTIRCPSLTKTKSFSVFNNFSSKNDRNNPVFVSTNKVFVSTNKSVPDRPLELKRVAEVQLICDYYCTGSMGFVLKNKVERLLDDLKWDDKGLIVAIAQNIDTGTILMQGFANREAVVKTATERMATFYSRSRSKQWTKGETSNNFIHVHDIFYDCDSDSIIYFGKPDGPACHTGSYTCFRKSLDDRIADPQNEKLRLALPTLSSLENTISQRKAELEALQTGKPSWTKRLLLDNKLLCSKIREEADELCRTWEEGEDKSRMASEMADVLYHAMVLLAVKEVKLEDVLQKLRERFPQSGIVEKENRALKVD